MDVFKQPFDPSDINAYEVDFSGLLEEGETIAAFTIVPDAGAAEAGFGIRDDGARAAKVIGGTAIRFWPEVREDERSHARWRGYGRRCVIEIEIATSAAPPRTLQRSFAVLVRQL